MLANVMIAIMAETNNASDHSLLWGYPIEIWDSWGLRALVWGAVLGVVALLLTAASAYVLYRVADVAQKGLETESKSSAEKIAELTARTAEAEARTKEAQLKLAEVEDRNERRAMPRGMLVKSLAACREVLKDKPKGKVEILWLKAFGDGEYLSFLLESCFHSPPDEKGWMVVGRQPVDELPPEARGEEGIIVIGQRHGVFPFNVLPSKRPSDVLSDVVAHGLTVALDTTIIRVGVGVDRSMPEDLVRIFIGAK